MKKEQEKWGLNGIGTNAVPPLEAERHSHTSTAVTGVTKSRTQLSDFTDEGGSRLGGPRLCVKCWSTLRHKAGTSCSWALSWGVVGYANMPTWCSGRRHRACAWRLFTTVSQFPSPVKEPQAERREEAEEGWAREKIGRTRRNGGYGRGWLGCGNEERRVAD